MNEDAMDDQDNTQPAQDAAEPEVPKKRTVRVKVVPSSKVVPAQPTPNPAPEVAEEEVQEALPPPPPPSAFAQTATTSADTPFYHVLGDPTVFAQTVNAEELERNPPPPPPQLTLQDLPPDVREVARLTADGGASILQAYERFTGTRNSLADSTARLDARADPMPEFLTTYLPMASGEPVPAEVSLNSRHLKALERWGQQEMLWERQRDTLLAQTYKDVPELVMDRAQEYRRKMEALQELQAAIPVEERFGAEQWIMSLRNNWTRYVPVGNLFSGLFCSNEEAHFDVNELERITAHGNQVNVLQKSRRGVMGRGWESSRFLSHRRRQYRKRIEDVIPPRPDFGAGEDDGLFVRGVAVSSVVGREDGGGDMTMQDLEDFLASDERFRGTLEEIYLIRRAKEEEKRRQAEAEAARLQELERLQKLLEPVKGPCMYVHKQRLALDCESQGSARGSVKMTNRGTVTLRYTWTGEPRALPDHARGLKEPNRAFYASKASGVLLPGESAEIYFTFRPQYPGIYTENWSISCIPSLPEQATPITLRGIAVAEDSARLQRRQLETDLRAKETKRHGAYAVECVLRKVVDGPTPTRAPHKPDTEAGFRESAFLLSNRGDPEGRCFYFSDELADALEKLAASLADVPRAADDAAAKDPKAKKGEPEVEVKRGPEDALAFTSFDAFLTELEAEVDTLVSEAETAVAAEAEGSANLEALQATCDGMVARRDAIKGMRQRLDELVYIGQVPIDETAMKARCLSKLWGDAAEPSPDLAEAAVAFAEERLVEAKAKAKADREKAHAAAVAKAEEEGTDPPEPEPEPEEDPEAPTYDRDVYLANFHERLRGSVLNTVGDFERAYAKERAGVRDLLNARIIEADTIGGVPQLWTAFELQRLKRRLHLDVVDKAEALVAGEEDFVVV